MSGHNPWESRGSRNRGMGALVSPLRAPARSAQYFPSIFLASISKIDKRPLILLLHANTASYLMRFWGCCPCRTSASWHCLAPWAPPCAAHSPYPRRLSLPLYRSVSSLQFNRLMLALLRFLCFFLECSSERWGSACARGSDLTWLIEPKSPHFTQSHYDSTYGFDNVVSARWTRL